MSSATTTIHTIYSRLSSAFISYTQSYHTFSDEGVRNISEVLPVRRNAALEAVRQAGLQQLEETTQVIAKKSSKSLLLTDSEESSKPNLKQLRMASTLLDVMEDIMELYCTQVSELCVQGEPLEVTDVEVSPDLGAARIYWTLPDVMEDKPIAQVRAATEYIQRLIDEKHGRHIQHLVAGRLRRFRYVPRLRFVAENTDLTHSSVVRSHRKMG